MRQSRWWPEDASDVSAYATTLASLITLLLFLIAWRQLRLLRDQVRVSSEEMEAARASASAAQVSAEAAIEASREAARTRVDSYSPRLVVHAALEPGALVDPSRPAMPGGNDLRLLDSRSIQQSRVITEGEEFIFDRDRQHFIWFRVSGSVQNEGNGSGKVRLDGEAHFSGAEQGEEIVLKPGEERTFEWGVGFPASTLADRRQAPQPARGFLVITGTSYEEKGVVDRAYLELASRSLQEVQGHQGAFTFRERLEGSTFPPTVVVVYPLQRTYRWDWDAGSIPAPPWPPDEEA
jgi:hypothetical protein